MANIDNSNNFFIKPPKFSWLEFSYSQELLSDMNSLKNQSLKPSINKNQPVNNNSKSFNEMKTESRSQSFIELTKLLTDDCQYGILDEYAGTKEEREKEKHEKELKERKKQEEEKEAKEFEEKIKSEYVIVDKNVPGITTEEFNRMLMKEKEKKQIVSEVKKQEMFQSSSLEKIDLNTIDKKNFSRVPFSAPVKSNIDENFNNIEKFNRRGSFDQNIIHINGPEPNNTSNMRSIIKPLNDVSILSNNNIATIEIKTPLPKENSSDLFKAFLKGDYDPSKGDEKSNAKPLKKEEVEEDNEVFENRNQLEKFKTSESSTSLNVLLESINIKCSSTESLPRNDSLDSLESVEFDNTKNDLPNNNNDNSWISNISKSFQSWLSQKNDYDLNYFTRTDKDGNIQILSVNSIMELYGIDFDQALNIHEYVTAKIPKFPQNITGYTKYIEKLNSKNASPKETRILELVHRHRGLKPIISGELARQLQNQLPDNLRSRRKWTMQFSLNSLDSDNDTSKDMLNLSKLLSASNNHGPCLIIIQDDNNYVFGAFINEELRNDMNSCYGTKECFIWKYQNSNLEIFRPIEECNDLIFSNNEFISIGGNNDGQFALYLDKRLKNGHSYRNKTFKSKTLSSFNDFYISELELWTFE